MTTHEFKPRPRAARGDTVVFRHGGPRAGPRLRHGVLCLSALWMVASTSACEGAAAQADTARSPGAVTPAGMPSGGIDPHGDACEAAPSTGLGARDGQADAAGAQLADVPPNIREVLRPGCGGTPTIPPGATGLRKLTLTTPGAVCNDGTPAVMFVRPASDPASANRWLIFLKGGGQCDTYESCAARWCNADGSDSKTSMSSAWEPSGITGTGIFAQDPQNGFAGWNQVFVHYCSSDVWTGANRVAVQTSADGGAPYSLPFMGRRIFESVIATLRAGAVSDDRVSRMPSLDAATLVVLAGGSAGSVGAQQNLDLLASAVDPARTRVRGIFDAIISPPVENLPEPSMVEFGEQRARAREQWNAGPAGWHSAPEASCATRHSASGDLWRCFDSGHVVAHHVTTPFFARSDLIDPLVLQGNPYGFDAETLAQLTREALLRVHGARATAEERASIAQSPAVFGPLCYQHVALLNSAELAGESVVDAAAQRRTLGGAITHWLNGSGFSAAVDTPAQPTSQCP